MPDLQKKEIEDLFFEERIRLGIAPKLNRIFFIENKMLYLFSFKYFLKKKRKFSEETRKNHFSGHDHS